MIKVKYKQYKGLLGHQFVGAVRKLLSASTDGQSAYNLRKALKPLVSGGDEVAKAWDEKIVEKFAKNRKEDGKVDPANPGMPEEGTDAEFDKALVDFENMEIEVRRPKLTAHDIRAASLSADELEALEPVVDEESFEKAQKPGNPMKLVQ